MWELMVCVSVAWTSSCQWKAPEAYPSAYFCERAAERVLKQPTVRQVFCRAKKRKTQ